MNLYPEFEGKVVVITGVASGIGFEQAKAFLDAGAKVFGADILNGGQVYELNEHGDFTFTKCDVSNLQSIEAWLNPIVENYTIDILVNTAGILDDYTPTLATTEKLWDQILDTNLKSVFRTTNIILPQMVEEGQGTIVNMASIAGQVAGGGGAAYTTSKFGIIGYTKQLDYDYASKGIRANCIAPGAVDTPMNAKDFEEDNGKMAQWVAEETPAHRWAKPEEVAALTLFLASPRADYIHGAAIPIDGGWLEK